MTDNQVKVNAGRKTVNYIVKVAILAALSAVIMLLEFPLPFAPGFYKLDLSEAVILMGGFAMGPVSGGCHRTYQESDQYTAQRNNHVFRR